MNLKQYLAQTDMTGAAFAAAIGRDPSTVSKLINGHVKPDSVTIEAIYKATDGAVTANDFYGHAAPVTSSPTPEGPAP